MLKLDGRILVVDDSSLVREMIKQAVYKMGFRKIDDAADGKRGLEKINQATLQKAPYNLIFLDVNMPEMNGLELLEEMRKNTATANIPVVMVTTESAKQVVIRAVMTGISGYVVKPFTIDDIQKKVVEISSRTESGVGARG